jgi:predicted transcriptional regulator
MTFSIYLDDKLAARLKRTAEQSRKSRNAIIREALAEWLSRSQPNQWPKAVREFRGVRNAPRFEAYRKELRPPREPFQ